ncbi:MAG: response regulator [Candidatus Omnitrophota bacterium]|jgi:DNA-binding response OmpR family regulator
MKKILVVDDEKNIRDMYASLLVSEGFKVIEASNASDTNEILKKENIDLVLLDIKMPDVDGQTLSEVIQLFHKKTKIIVSSVYHPEEQKRMISWAHDYYDKSQGIEVLLKKIKGVVENGAS